MDSIHIVSYIRDFMVDKFDPEKTVDLVWVRDSETGDRVLVDRLTNRVVGVWRNEKKCPLCGQEKV